MTTDKSKNFFRVSAEDFKKIPGSPIAYWASDQIGNIFENSTPLIKLARPCQGMATTNNSLFVRNWQEISIDKSCFIATDENNAFLTGKKWFPYNKGGEFRKWYGNATFLLNYENKGKTICDYIDNTPNVTVKSNGRVINRERFFLESISWSKVSSGNIAIRYFPSGFIFDVAGCSIFAPHFDLYMYMGFMNSQVCRLILASLSPTVNFEVGQINILPVLRDNLNANKELPKLVDSLIGHAKQDWDSYETSWDFQSNPLCVSPQERAEQLSYGIHSEERKKAVSLISERYMRLRCDWQRQTEEMRKLEIENNRIFIEAYGLQDELSPEVPWNEITLTCNPWYRYGKAPKTVWINGEEWIESTPEIPVSRIWGVDAEKVVVALPNGKFRSSTMPANQELENRLLADTIKEFISYAVGCMMGRYSPEKPGLILANQGSTVDDYFNIMGDKEKHIANGDLFEQTTTSLIDIPYSENSFCGTRYHQIIDADGVLPILDEEWFVDDIVTQFKNFVAFIFGKENLTANMDFIEAVLGKDIRKYFVKDFYKEHIQRYKKRPIYWLFSSPKGSFNALIYLHRYTPDTVSIILNEYLRELMTKISTRIKHLIEENNRADISNSDKTRNLKQIDKYTAQLAELEDYERDVIFPLAQQKIAIDLDDGVKVNYCKFGAALKKIPGLEAKEE